MSSHAAILTPHHKQVHTGKHARKGADCQILFMKIFLSFPTPTKPAPLLHPQPRARSCNRYMTNSSWVLFTWELDWDRRPRAACTSPLVISALFSNRRKRHLSCESAIPPAYLSSDPLGSGEGSPTCVTDRSGGTKRFYSWNAFTVSLHRVYALAVALLTEPSTQLPPDRRHRSHNCYVTNGGLIIPFNQQDFHTNCRLSQV